MTTNESLSNEPSRNQHPRWPLYYAWVTSWIYPATTAQRTAHAPMWKVWLFHVCTLFMIALTICFIVALAEANTLNFLSIYDEFIGKLNKLTRELHAYPFQFIATISFSLLSIQLIFYLLAFLMMAWGARDEPIRVSLHYALRQLWIGTACIIPAMFLVSTLSIAITDHASYYQNPNIIWPAMPTPPTIAQSDPNFSAVTAKHKAAMDQYNNDMKILIERYTINHNAQPWYVRHPEFFVIFSSVIAVMWFIWALLRSMGASRIVPNVDRPPLCEYCGYNLTTMPMESRCPECGEPVIKSLGPEVRRGTAWDKHGQSTRWAAWKECFIESIVRPKEFGRTLQVTQPVSAHRIYLFCNLPVVFAIGAISMLVAFVIVTGMNPFRNDLLEFCFAIVIFGCACVIGTVAVTLFGGWLIGWGHGIKYKRNLMPVSIQASCYLSGYLILWAILGALNFLFLHWGYEYRIFHSIRDVTGMYVDTIATLFWFVPNVTCGIYYLLLIARTTSGAWYANR